MNQSQGHQGHHTPRRGWHNGKSSHQAAYSPTIAQSYSQDFIRDATKSSSSASARSFGPAQQPMQVAIKIELPYFLYLKLNLIGNRDGKFLLMN